MKKQPKHIKSPKSSKTAINESTPSLTDTVSWRFSFCDKEYWPLLRLDNKLIVFLKDFEGQSWSYWLTAKNKKCHEIPVDELNKIARDRIEELKIELEKVIVFHIGNTECIYGYLMSGICHLLWYDDNHGDNDSCVCRSYLKHT